MNNVNWGILGCGGIAHTFMTSMGTLDRGTVLAGASRTPGKARDFAQKYSLQHAYEDYESLATDARIDAVYVATTHNFHYENVKLCLENGKHVLCEKPFTINARQAEELIALARERNLFLMEAVWTRFLPAIRKLQEILAQGIIGDVQTVKADFPIMRDFDPEHRLWNKSLAGGALLDLGIYPLTFTDIVFDENPCTIKSSAVIGGTGVDERSFYLLEYGEGRRAMLSSSFTCHGPIEAMVLGTKGHIRIPHFLGAQELHVHLKDSESPDILKFPFGTGENFKYEIDHAMACIENGKTESDILPLPKTLAIMQTMDSIRTQWGLKYDGE